MNKPAEGQSVGWQQFISGKLKGRQSEVTSFDKIVIRARTSEAKATKIKVALITKEGAAFTGFITTTAKLENLEIPFSKLKNDLFLLLPRPYPGFQPLQFYNSTGTFNINDLDKLQVLVVADEQVNTTPVSVEIESIFLQKRR